MPRAEPLPDEVWEMFDSEAFCTDDRYDSVVPAEAKQSSFGRIGGRIVAVDYG